MLYTTLIGTLMNGSGLNSEIDPNKYGQVVFDICQSNSVKKVAFSTNGSGAVRHPQAKDMNLDLNFSPYTEINSRWITSVQFSSVAQSCPTLCDPMNHSTPDLPVHHQLLEFT